MISRLRTLLPGGRPASEHDPARTPEFGPLALQGAMAVVLAIGGAVGLYMLLAWLLGVSPHPSGSGAGHPALPLADQQKLLTDLVKVALGLAAGIGAAFALVVSFRRVRAEEAASHRDDRRLFSSRYQDAADLIGSDKAAVRLAGIYAMARLADDWTEQRQQCIDVLCAYLRLPYDPDPEHGDLGEREVRHSVIALIRDRLQPGSKPSWIGRNFDFNGAVFDGGNFAGAHFTGGTVVFSGAQFTGGTVHFNRAQFARGIVDFSRARFTGGTVYFHKACFTDSIVDFTHTKVARGTVDFGNADFDGAGIVDFKYAHFTGGTVVFSGTRFCGGTVDFNGAKFTGSTVRFNFAKFNGSTVTFAAEFIGGAIRFRGAEFCGGDVNFDSAEFAGSTVRFDGARFTGGAVSFRNAMFSDGIIDFDDAQVAGGTIDFDNAQVAGGTIQFDGTGFIGGTLRFGATEFTGGAVDLTTAVPGPSRSTSVEFVPAVSSSYSPRMPAFLVSQL